jgi:MFS family permease
MIITPQFSSDDVPAADLAISVEEEALRQRVLRNPGVRALVVSRFASVLGIATLSYGAMIYLATIGAPQFAISLMGATGYVAALAFGIGGGTLSEIMSKRRAMVTAYALQAAACFIVPTVWGPVFPAFSS